MTLLHTRLALEKLKQDHPALSGDINAVIDLLVEAGKKMTAPLKLTLQQTYDLNWYVNDENYDGAEDAGKQAEGFGNTPLEALTDYFNRDDIDPTYDYIIPGDFFK